jgi:hypothetical protein
LDLKRQRFDASIRIDMEDDDGHEMDDSSLCTIFNLVAAAAVYTDSLDWVTSSSTYKDLEACRDVTKMPLNGCNKYF